MLLTLVAFIFALGLLVIIHELGHYSVARWCGVKVLRFSVGFGPVLFKRVDKHKTEWAVSAIPLGGYVKMLDSREEALTEYEKKVAFDHKSVYQRFAIVIAGPLANLLLASFLYAMISWWGTPEPIAILNRPAISTPLMTSPIESGDRVVAVGNEAVQTWSDLSWRLLDVASEQGLTHIKVLRPQTGETFTVPLDFSTTSMKEPDSNPLAQLGLSLRVPNAKVERLSDTAVAGLLPGDVILAVNGQAVTIRGFLDAVNRSPNQSLSLDILRNQRKENISITPNSIFDKQSNKNIGKIGIYLTSDMQFTTVRLGLLDGLLKGFQRTYDVSVFSLKMLGKMLFGEVSWKNLSGPITIADYAGQTARLGMLDYIGFIALVSISLGVLNLLPVPVLDGGHLTLYLIEMVRGKPVSELWVARSQRLGMAMVLTLMIIALFNDITRYL